MNIQLGPQAFDVAVHRADIAEVIKAPQTVEQIVPAEHLFRILRQCPQQINFFLGQRDLIAAEHHLCRFQPHLKLTDAKHAPVFSFGFDAPSAAGLPGRAP